MKNVIGIHWGEIAKQDDSYLLLYGEDKLHYELYIDSDGTVKAAVTPKATEVNKAFKASKEKSEATPVWKAFLLRLIGRY